MKLNKNEDYNKEKEHKRRIKIAFMRVSLMSMLLIFSTYAWFTSQKDITLSNIRGVVEVVENMEISLDAKNWYQHIDLSNAQVLFQEAQESRDEALGETNYDAKSTALAIVPSQLLPVSGVGEKNGATMPLYSGEATSTSLSGITKCLEETTDLTNKEISVDNGYFAFDIYIKNASRDNENDILQLNLNSAAQVLTETIRKKITDDFGNEVERNYIGNEDAGLQNTIRVALALYSGEIISTATQKEILDSTKNATIKDIAIWEPNAFDHVESVVANNNKLINETESNKIPFQNLESVDTYALNSSAVTAGEITNVYNIKSTGLALQNTLKTDNVKNGENEVVDYGIYTEDLKPIDIKNIDGNNFELGANTVNRLRVYVWLEGQDIDCINVASLGGGIELDLGLTKDNEVGDGGGSRLLAEVDYDLEELENGEVTATIMANREIILPDGWNYAVTESVAVASTENMKIATSKQNKNVISKVYSANTEEFVEITDKDGNRTVVKIKIEEIENDIGLIKNTNIGDYVDLGNDLVRTSSTKDDWRVLYTEDTNADGKTDKVHVILSDYLSAEKIPTGIGLSTSTTNYQYIVMTNSASDLINGLKHETAWDSLANGKSNEVVGGPTKELLEISLNAKYGTTDLDNDVESTAEDYDLYVPHTVYVNECNGYWLASSNGTDFVWSVAYIGYFASDFYGRRSGGVRPVVTLTEEVTVIKDDGIWKITN